MVIKFSIHMYNRYKLKVTKFEGISQCISEVIVEKLRGGAKIAPPPPGLNRKGYVKPSHTTFTTTRISSKLKFKT